MEKGKERASEADEHSAEATEQASSDMAVVDKPSRQTDARYNRLKLFDKVMQTSLNKYIEHASFNRFASMFRPLYKKNPQRMESIHKQFIEELKKTIQEDISRLIEEGRLEFKLNELDKLESAAKNNPDQAWRPSGVPEQDFCSFLVPYYLKQEAYMRLELKKIKAENAALAQRVQAGRESIAQTEHQIAAAVDESKASAKEFERLTSSLCPADVFDV
ncbi:polyamine-modulated factor 1 [Parambassis ranga]|uniref:Polyamine-modulated factor 1 n=1 Tax=Parambassis ranga TaxID=210632 RepID=A0A6P7J423_9TELE|nr:polyamine-modulated factor 1-like [Parambassis ranga]